MPQAIADKAVTPSQPCQIYDFFFHIYLYCVPVDIVK